jgi:ankyrin repeat protein
MVDIITMKRIFLLLFVVLLCCSRDIRTNTPKPIGVYHGEIQRSEKGPINLRKLKQVLENYKYIGVLSSGEFHWSVLHVACYTGQIDAVRMMLKYKKKLNLNADVNGSTPLGFAVSGNHYDIAKLLLENGADPNCDILITIRSYPRSALAEALYSDNKKMFNLLKKYGADINAKGQHGMTEFLRCDDVEYLKKLIKVGADVHAVTKDGRSKFFMPPDSELVDCRELEEIVKLLKKCKLNINAVGGPDKITPLMNIAYPTYWDFSKVAAIFIKNGANVNAQDKNGNTVLHRIAMDCAKEALKPRSSFAANDYLQLLQAILYHNPKLNLKNKDGLTALKLCEKFKIKILADELRKFTSKSR